MLGFNGGTIGIANTVFTGSKSNDPNYSSVSLLLNGNGTNGSTTFTDSSSYGHTVTPVGNAQISTTQSKFGGASMYFDGSGDRLTVSDSSFTFGTGEFTIEFWVYILSAGGLEAIASCGSGNSSWQLRFQNTDGGIDFRVGSNSYLQSTTTTSFNTWHHFAVTRDSSNTGRMFLNGTIDDSSTFTDDLDQSDLRIGVNRSGDYYFDGYIDDFRITKGVARYTSNFTPPTAQLPGAETGTFASGLWTSSDHIKQIRNELWPGL